MTTEADFDRFRAVVAEAFDADPAQIERSTTAADVHGWNSVSHAALIMGVEDVYGFQFPDEEIFSFEDIGALFDRTMQLRQRR